MLTAILLSLLLPVAVWWCCCNSCKGAYCDSIAAHGTLATAMTTGGACRTPRPTQATITISGMGNKACVDCDQLDGTWVADLAHYPGTGCRWATAEVPFSPVSGFCAAFYFVVAIHCTGKVQVTLGAVVNAASEYVFQNIDNAAPSPNCSALGVLTMADWVDNSVYCDFSGATVTGSIGDKVVAEDKAAEHWKASQIAGNWQGSGLEVTVTGN